jgi:hypothetical protein
LAIHFKSKVKRLKVRGSPVPGRELKLLEDELSSLRKGYEMAVDYVRSTQEKLLESRLDAELLSIQLKAASAQNRDPDFDIDGGLLEELKRKAAVCLELEAETSWLKRAIAEIHRELTGRSTDETADIREVLGQIQANLGGLSKSY